MIEKTYDGNTNATIDSSHYTLNGQIISGENLSLNATSIQYQSANATTGSETNNPVTLTNPTLEGQGAEHYVINNPQIKFAGKVLQREVTVKSLGTTLKKTYDGNTNINVVEKTDYTVNGIIDNDINKVQINYSIVLDDKNVKNANTATMTMSGLKGEKVYTDNYVLKTTSLEYQAKVEPISLHFTAKNMITKNYDGDNTAKIVSDDYTLSPIVNGENISLNFGNITYDNSKAGSQKKVTAIVNGLLAGNEGTDSTNYSFADSSVIFEGRIVGIPVTIQVNSGTITKVYDGTTTATVTEEHYSLIGDNLPANLKMTATAHYANKNVGDSKITLSDIQLSGEGSENYEIINPDVQFDGQIDKKSVQVVKDVDYILSKEFDGNTNINIPSGAYKLDWLFEDDNINIVCQATFTNSNAGDHKDITATFTLSGDDVSNYSLTGNKLTYQGDIKKKTVDVSWESLDSYTYSGENQSNTIQAYYTDIDNQKQSVAVDALEFINAGEYDFKTSAKPDNYELNKSTYHVVMNAADIKDKKVTGIDDKGYAHTGQQIEINSIGIEGLKNSDFDVEYKNNTSLGTAKVILTGKENYTGQLTATFLIYAAEYPGDVLPIEGRNENDFYKEDISVTVSGHTVGTNVNDTKDSLVLTQEGHPSKQKIYIINSSTGQIYQKEISYDLDKTIPVIGGLDSELIYYVDVPFTATDENNVTVTIDGSSVAENKIQGNVDKQYVVLATDSAGNTTSIIVTTKPIESLVDKKITLDNVKSNDKNIIENQIKALEGIDQTDASQTQKDEIVKLIQECSDLLDSIKKSKEDLENIQNQVNALDKDTITAGRQEELNTIIERLNQMTNSAHYTEDEKTTLNDLQKIINDLLDMLNQLEKQIKDLETQMKAYTTDNVKDSDANQLHTYKESIDNLLKNTHLTNEQKERLNTLKDYINQLEKELEKLHSQLDQLDEIKDITVDDVTADHQEVIDKIKDVITNILKDHQDNLTDEQKKHVDEVSKKLDDLQKVIDDIKKQIKDIHDVVYILTPDKIKNSDQGILDAIKNQIADIDENNLTDDQKNDLNHIQEHIKELEDKLNELNEKLDQIDKVTDINKDNVSKDDQDLLDQVKDLIDTVEKQYQDNLTDDQKEHLNEIKDKLDELQEVIHNIQDKIDKIKEQLYPITPENVQQSDRHLLDELKKQIDELLNSNQLDDSQRKDVNNMNDYIERLYDRIHGLDKLDEMKDKLDSLTKENIKVSDKNILDEIKDGLEDLLNQDCLKDKKDEIKDLQDKVKDLEDVLDDVDKKLDELDKIADINKDNVSKDDQERLDHVKDIIDDIENQYQDNLTDDQKDLIHNTKDKINDLENVIDGVKDVEKEIGSLETKDDYTDEEKDIVNDVHNHYELLTDHQKDMVDPLLTEKLETILEIVRKKSVKNDEFQFVVEGLNKTDFDINTVLLVKKIDNQLPSYIQQSINKSLNADAEMKDIYDIQLLLNGKVIQPNGKIRIRIALTSQQQTYKNIQLFYVSDMGELTQLDYVKEGNTIVFETDHLSYYAIVASRDDKVNNDSHKNDNQFVQTEDNNNIVSLEVFALASACLFIFLRKKKEL